MHRDKQRDSGNKLIIREPFTIAIHLLLGGIVVLFLGLTYGYLFQMGEHWLAFRMPKVFWLSTVTILCVSVFLQQLVKSYDKDNSKLVRRNLLLAFAFACVFIGCQVQGWLFLIDNNIRLGTSPSTSYMYLLTGLHGIHVLVGIIFLTVGIFRAFVNTSDEVKSLIYFSDPMRRTRLRLLRNYWHTIDFLWVFLFLVFLYKHT